MATCGSAVWRLSTTRADRVVILESGVSLGGQHDRAVGHGLR
jgi:hypothetical protein